uniref:Transcription factor MYB12 n=1 Tax=Diospyros kaki TaxID=35925 RepID=A0A2P1ENA6_DIOKA|nr:transcription factor MYB12 [Diospyros kaki]
MSRCCGAGGDGNTVGTSGVGGGEIMLFGVRVKVDPMRKTVSMNNLSQYEQPLESSNGDDVAAAGGYASADDSVHHRSAASLERKRGVPWTEEEHKLFLLGLQKVGKGDWRGISRNFVKTRTPTQVASHAQKYFLRRSNLNRRRRRSSLFDITAESVIAIPMGEETIHQERQNQPPLPPTLLPSPKTSNISGAQVLPFPVTACPVLMPTQIENPMGILTPGQIDQANYRPAKLIHPTPVLPPCSASKRVDVDLNQNLTVEPLPLSLNSLVSHDQDQLSRHSSFQVMPSFGRKESILSIA